MIGCRISITTLSRSITCMVTRQARVLLLKSVCAAKRITEGSDSMNVL